MSKVNLDLMPLDLRSHLVFIKDQIEWFEGGVIDRDENDNPICIRDYCNLDTAKYWLDMFIELEKDLGCPLEVVFKALKEGFIDSEYNLLRTAKSLEYRDNEWVLVMIGCRGKQWYYPLKEYGKSWWLKGYKVE